ncbi:MAG: membrane protein insertase YidC [Gallionellales bacterium 35-53-114]|jgi:YidC/Oxa1 family membrane protein insertase|nr:MAG: membrane protein insertase YidC [Gallionellales bacterium 35-53-114]OYZ63573.1 MAG: membrane protein insertase YidC [Gallionellales bacterium 24-53-125]OZB10817.1 MAG: membrane protein insertase YidC [Gallionellales bacterium 39-52-133]HQS59011.1 membrane protein insertase YidC [Gallionellaceae bacterium]HQS75604.1 membrane protein insertase YidC [Gallionellaceae bacterium]
MDFQRVFLFLIFSFSIFLLWEGWQKQQNPVQQVVSVNATPVPSPTLKTIDTPAKPLVSAQQIQKKGEKIIVKTDFLRAEISTLGGDIVHIELLKHFDTADKTKPFVLFQQEDSHKYIAQSGLLGAGLPTHNTEFSAEFKEYELAKGKETVEISLTSKNSQGAKVIKRYVFHKSSYLIDVNYEVTNLSNENLVSSAYFQLIRDDVEPAGGTMFVPTYTGPAVYTDKDKFQKIDFASISKNSASVPQTADNGWAGMLQHYFVSAWLPKGNTPREFYVKQLENKLYSVGLILPVTEIEPGKSGGISVPLYVGPAQSSLDAIAPGLGLSVDYGFLTIIAKPLFWLLTFIHNWVQNWGLAIIILTILIKLAFFPLSAASYRSMAKMRVVAPKLAKIKEQYSDDRERLNRAMMDLYKTEKINPLGGCLPVLIQIPVFISLYWAILASVEMRYAPFIGWITDLSKADPYYVLPIVMGISMVIQTKLNPTPPDPMQAKLMQIMPVAFSVVFFFFPAGLVLYSVVNNVLSIAQQWYITRNTEAEAKGAAKV